MGDKMKWRLTIQWTSMFSKVCVSTSTGLANVKVATAKRNLQTTPKQPFTKVFTCLWPHFPFPVVDPCALLCIMEQIRPSFWGAEKITLNPYLLRTFFRPCDVLWIALISSLVEGGEGAVSFYNDVHKLFAHQCEEVQWIPCHLAISTQSTEATVQPVHATFI